MSNAFEPTNPTDNCAYCGRVRANLWHRVTSDPGTHAFVEAPQPAPSGDEATYPDGEQRPGRQLNEERLLSAAPVRPSGDEAKVREIAERWFPGLMDTGMPAVLGAVRDGYAAGKADGKADGAREATDKAWEWVATVASKEEADECREFIARRGSEGK